MTKRRTPVEIERARRFVWQDGDIAITPAPQHSPQSSGDATNGKDPAAWPEFIYRLIEHYKWEPQHLRRGSMAEVNARMRRQEVPLNFLFNILLRWLSPDEIRELLSQFGVNQIVGELRVESLWSTSYAQPDVRIESDCCRVFVEVKVDALVKLQQVQLLLHSEMDLRFGQKQPYLLFLTREPFAECWRPSSEWPREGSVQDCLRLLSDAPLSGAFSHRASEEARARYQNVKDAVAFGTTTWKSIRQRLEALALKAQEGAGRRLIGDFVSDLRSRNL